MLSQTQSRDVKALLERLISPIFLLYLDVNPAKAGIAGKEVSSELALSHGGRQEFVRVNAEQGLMKEFGGMGRFSHY